MSATIEPTSVAESVSTVPGSTSKPSPKNRLGPGWRNRLRSLFGLPTQRRLARAALLIDHIRFWESEFSRLSDAEIKKRGQQFKGRARGGESLDHLLPEIFGLICVASVRQTGLRPYDVQLAGGIVMHHGALAELATGEGKTLTATLPAALNALEGKGAHVTTVNDYLAKRDAEWCASIYNAIGLTVGCLQQQMPDQDRAAAYKADITYGTASEFGFDFLRDRLKIAGDKGQAMPFWTPWTLNGQFARPLDPKVQRPHHFVLVDEADNIFVDEARTPLIIASPTRPASEEEQIVYLWADHLARMMQPEAHFTIDDKKQKVELTDEAKQIIRYSNPPMGEHSHAMDKLHEHVERAVQAHHRFRIEQHYLIEDNKVVIIDEFTGRRQPDRHWRDGLNQAVEAKERVPITKAADHAAQITYQKYFRLYKKLCGMTGTAWQNWWELRRVYKLWVVPVPTNRPVIREHWPDRIFPTEQAKFDAVAEEVIRLHQLGRPVLVGTRSVEKSEQLSQRLHEANIPHNVLNAKPEIVQKESEIVAQAGRYGAVTIATNMAGRGTDIILGGNAEFLAWEKLHSKYSARYEVPPDEWKQTVHEFEERENIKELKRRVVEAGGLHVLGTERHDARRVDRQLQGRAARQGDPGSCQFFLSLEDELLDGLGKKRREALKELGKQGGEEDWDRFQSLFLKAQRRVERRHYKQRLDLMLYERQRQEILKDLGADPYVD